MNLTVEEWFDTVGVDLPARLEGVWDVVITTRKDLEWTGIFECLDIKLKESANMEDELEAAFSNWDSLDKSEQAHIKLLLNNKEWKKHPYVQLLHEKIERDKKARSEQAPDLPPEVELYEAE